MRKSKSFDLGNDKILKIVLTLALPAMLGQFVNVLYGLIDRIYIGNIQEIGDIALAGVGISTPVTTLLTSFSFLVGVGAAPLLSMSLGAGDKEKAKKIMANSVVMLLGLSLLVTLIVLIFLEPLLRLFGATSSNFYYAKSYLGIYLIGAPFAIMALGLNQLIICQGFSKVGMRTMLVGAILNIVLDPLFIFVFHLDVMGAAIATVISQMASFAFTVFFLFGKKTIIRISFGNYDLKLMLKIIIMGLSPFIILATDSVVNISLNTALKLHAGSNADFYLTVGTITTSFYLLLSMPLMGISGGTQAVLSYNYGAKKYDRVKKAEKVILLLGVIFTCLFFGLSFVIGRPFAMLFSSNQEIIDATAKMIQIYMYGSICLAFQYVFVDGLTALARPGFAAAGSLFRKAILIALTWVLPLGMGVAGCFWAEAITDLIGAAFATLMFMIAVPKMLRTEVKADILE